MITGNKGEWSEIYTLFKVLGDTVLFPGDENIHKLGEVFYPIIKVIREETGSNYEYSLSGDVVVVSGNEEVLRIPIAEFKEKALILLEAIQNNKQTTFTVPEIEDFMEEIKCISLKAGSGSKTDIRIVVHDQRTGQQPVLGFSIKSQLGHPSTLLNAGKTTNFIYEIEEVVLSNVEINEINLIDSRNKIKDRLQSVVDKGGNLKFVKTENNIFSNNLILIDSLLPNILAFILKVFNSSKYSSLTDLLKILEAENPLNFDIANQHKFYSYKLKRFLTDVALGMMPSVVWSGEYDATGGYLIVKDNGEVLCYHIYNRSDFENYLLNNTKLETASSTRHDFGKVYEEGQKQYFKLNLQIRFIK